ncbi:DUF3365 domain-containing protein [Maribacter sp. MAR_2009_72]|uniref:Tll0287-like domain-containing protein n=1 Tax=Maribacter sp. MAR_2009_72 TaxID=1250050 RepID=UPI00119B39F6|nr:DUF3365 domain-containing protein [Maribacter sp. MAR_2009_72]TVZ14716.1 uncharacterized protein DUF3365 [Maribacter sp. MAR_2009_72]
MKHFTLLLGLLFFIGCQESPKNKQESLDDVTNESKINNTMVVDLKTNDSILLEKGKKFAQSTQKVLGKNLMTSLQKSGTVGAVEFCNEKAYPLTDSMALVHHAKIRRVSDKPRNTNNQANQKELEYIEFFKSKINNNEPYEPIISNEDGTTNFYSPIITNAMCLNCHGVPEMNIDPKVTQLLNNKYPYDQAVGYTKNEVRGIWSITFNNELSK